MDLKTAENAGILLDGARLMLINCVAYREGKKLADIDIDEISDYLQRSDCFVWVALRDATPDELEKMRVEFDLHALAIEDANHGHQRPKLEEYGDSLFAVIHLLEMEHGEIAVGEVDIFVGGNFILSVRNRSGQPLLGVRERCEREPEVLKQGSGFVLYALMDAVVDRYFPIVDAWKRNLKASRSTSSTSGAARLNIERLYDLKRRVTVVKHAVAPLMEAVSKLASGRVPPVSASSRHYFRDVYDHLARINAHLDILRDTIGTAIQVSLSSVAIEQNDVAKRLAAWAGIFAVATAFAGIWGMNFEVNARIAVGIRLSAGADADRWRHGISFLPLSAPGMAMMNNGRPDPDQLLARVQEEEAKAARGKLKIFFGASAGVGKTYAMLGAARQQKELGTDVVIGVVETHGRKETEALITGLERLPLCEIPYRGKCAEGVRSRRRTGATPGVDPDGRTGSLQRCRLASSQALAGHP
jgi:magnesium transporter